MSAPRTRAAGALLAALLTTVGVAALAPGAASAAGPSYTVTVGSPSSFGNVMDSPAAPYLDKDGSFHYQESEAIYGQTDPRAWKFFAGRDFDSATADNGLNNAVNPANSSDRNNDTTWRCNNSPTGLTASPAPSGSSYAQKNYCDLIGTWVDPDTGDWYGLVHNEFSPQPFGDGLHFDAIDYAVSTDQGHTWTIKDHAITSPYSTTRGDTGAFPNQTYYYGDGDQRLLVDTASGYFYVFYGSRVVDKSGGWKAFYEHAARAPIAGKMAAGTWQKWYDGAWTEAGVGGRESNMVPADASNPTGYTPVAKEYSPATVGTSAQQIAAGQMPATSPLFVMDVTYDAYLGLYVGEPQAVDQSGNAPQQYYVTSDLATQKWTLAGDSGSYHTASWYRWYLDGANRTSSQIVGKSFRTYCNFGCSGGRSGEYVNVTLDSSTPAAAPVDLAKSYVIGAGNARVLAQAAGSTATTSVPAATGSARESWAFAANGDGSYRITNSGSGQLLGVDSTTNAGRAWGAQPTVTAANGTVGQQWFLLPNTAAAGTFRIVNRYSGLVLGLSGTTGRLAETTPGRNWTDTSGSSVGGGRTGAEQTLTLTASGTAPVPVSDGAHTLTAGGKALDDPNHSTSPGTQLITWSPNGGSNQSWVFTRQSDGSYQIVNGQSQLCMDVSGGSTSPGAAIIQWTCTGGANQRWMVSAVAGGYAISAASDGLLLTTASTANGALVTQQAGTGSSLQTWTIG
ncbi:Ricin-type beta-trefoil lectin domain protein [Kitasatospora sp. MMS16-BH015]|uniref:RICIN domain-containing protein n=1 Tax=Kitasatospora sp. MMS16-BH015 TaxID=2018025 RepID=UPI000CA2B3EF|nr:RICIN domain-containing protein [Kitasatospora sp. MMS16-BH015]AUG81724.1 Ricin-type beta-trefoil lectin domain protein [Kitasatospora sp. MMS16-BH015]